MNNATKFQMCAFLVRYTPVFDTVGISRGEIHSTFQTMLGDDFANVLYAAYHSPRYKDAMPVDQVIGHLQGITRSVINLSVGVGTSADMFRLRDFASDTLHASLLYSERAMAAETSQPVLRNCAPLDNIKKFVEEIKDDNEWVVYAVSAHTDSWDDHIKTQMVQSLSDLPEENSVPDLQKMLIGLKSGALTSAVRQFLHDSIVSGSYFDTDLCVCRPLIESDTLPDSADEAVKTMLMTSRVRMFNCFTGELRPEIITLENDVVLQNNEEDTWEEILEAE